MRRAKVTIIHGIDGEVYIEHNGKDLPFKIFSKQPLCGQVIGSKEIDTFFREKKRRHVSNTHPWKQQGRAEARKRGYIASSLGGVS